MKNILLCTLVCLAPSIYAQPRLTPPDMALGHWIITADMSGIIEQTLASMPEESRAMVRSMMEEQMKDSSLTQQCITQDTLNNFDQQVTESFATDTDCEFNVIESTSKKFVLNLQCSDSAIQITTNVINDKRHETAVITNVPGLGETEITSVSQWQSSTCPAGL